jgi:hypothetical protein
MCTKGNVGESKGKIKAMDFVMKAIGTVKEYPQSFSISALFGSAWSTPTPTAGWVSAGLCALEERKMVSPCRELNPGSSPSPLVALSMCFMKCSIKCFVGTVLVLGVLSTK